MTTPTSTVRDVSARRRGTARSLRRRLMRHYLLLAIGTLGALVVLMSIPFFDANR